MRKHSYHQPHAKMGGHSHHDEYHAQQHSAHKAKMTSHASGGHSLPGESAGEMESGGTKGKGDLGSEEAHCSDQHEPTTASPIAQHKHLAGMK